MSVTDPHQEEHADGIVEDKTQAAPAYFNVLFYGLIIWGVIFMAYYLFSGWSSQEEFQQKMAAHKGETPAQQQGSPPASSPNDQATVTKAAPAAMPGMTADGGALYDQHCSGCHGADGKGGFGPDLSGDYKYGKTVAATSESISNGRPGNMPAFGKKLSEDEIKALTDFILAL